MDQVDEALGDCLDGSTATTTSCADCQSTSLSRTTPPHGCVNGGVAHDFPGCSMGTSFTGLPKACYDGMVVE